MRNDLSDKAVVVTGGTKGIGLAIGLAFGRCGAHAYLTHRWGSADPEEVKRKFAEVGAPEPEIVEADVIVDEETVALLQQVKRRHDKLEVLVSNVSVVQPAAGVASYKRRSLFKSIEYSAWPFVAYLQQTKRIIGAYPRYVVGISSDGPTSYFSRYEYVAVSKSLMETLCRYLSRHLAGEDVRLNVIRTRNVLTDAVYEIFGADYVEFMRKFAGEEHFIYPEEIGNAVLALCSGMLDALSGQVLQVDKGMAFADTLMRLMERSEQLGLKW